MNARTARFEALAAAAQTANMNGARPLAHSVQDFDQVETRSLLRALWRGRWWVGGLSLAAAILVWLALHLVTPTYTVQARLMLDTRKAQVLSAVVSEVAPSEEVVNSEVGVLQSNLVIAKMLEGLTPAQRDALDPALKAPGWTAWLKGLVRAPAPASTDPEAVTARLTEAVRRLRSAYAQPSSYVMTVRVDMADPVLARDIANGLAEAYIALSIDNRRAAVMRATDWLDRQLADLRTKVEGAERAVAEFEAQSLISDGGTLDTVSKQLSDLNAELAAIRTARVGAEARLAQLTAILQAGDIEAAAAIVQTPAMADLAAQRLKLQQDDAVWARTYDKTQSRRVDIARKLDEIRVSMTSELQNAIAAGRSEVALAQDRETGLNASIRELETKVTTMTANQIGLRQLNREADAARQTYESFLARINETRAEAELQQPDALIVERATLPEAPSAPRPTLLAVLALVVTAALSSAWVLLREMAPVTFRSGRELAAATGLPVLAALPDGHWAATWAMLDDLRAHPNTAYAERIRQIRTALTLRAMPGGRGQSVLILGAMPGDGKTTTALALAHMIAMAGRTAILVDCDLRRPSVLKALGGRRNQHVDFADFIEFRCDLPEAICRPAGCDFDVLGVQDRLRSGADALSAVWLAPVLRALEAAYDFVILDAPALLAVPDALIVAQEVDTNFFLVDAGRTPRDLVTRGLSALSEAGISLRGMILNKVDAQTSPDKYDGGYGYDYWLPQPAPHRGWTAFARGDHPLLAGWHARWGKGAGAAVHDVPPGGHLHPRLAAGQDQPADRKAQGDHDRRR